MKKLWGLVFVVLVSISFVGCGGGGGTTPSGGTAFTPYIGEPIVVSGAVNPTRGQLQILNGNLCGADGNPIQLRGMSSMGIQWFDYTADTVINLVNDWHISVFRAAMYVSEGGYLTNPAVKGELEVLVQEAIRQGIYVIIDWHTLNDVTANPNGVKSQAMSFFDEMATKYGAYPNIIYEICNEPNGAGTTWAEIKRYANDVISVIRAKDPDGIIIVGTPSWSQEVDKPAADPVSGINIMYTLHFYAGTHGQWLRDRADAAMSRGIALFVTEWGTSEASGNGGPYIDASDSATLNAELWMNWMNAKNISWVNWSLCSKNETSAALKPGVSASGPWNASDLTESGAWVKAQL